MRYSYDSKIRVGTFKEAFSHPLSILLFGLSVDFLIFLAFEASMLFFRHNKGHFVAFSTGRGCK